MANTNDKLKQAKNTSIIKDSRKIYNEGDYEGDNEGDNYYEGDYDNDYDNENESLYNSKRNILDKVVKNEKFKKLIEKTGIENFIKNNDNLNNLFRLGSNLSSLF